MYAHQLGAWSPGQRIPPGWAVSAVMPSRPGGLVFQPPHLERAHDAARRSVLAPPPPAQPRPRLPRRGFSGPPAGTPGEEVTVGGDVTMGNPIRIRADDTGTVWTVLDVNGTGWVGLQPPYGPITRGVVRGIVSAPYTLGRVSAAGKYSAGERGTTIFQSTAPPPPPADYISPDMLRNIVDQAVGGSMATINPIFWPQFVAELDRRRAAGSITDAQYAHAMTRKDDPVKAQQEAFFIGVGGGDVPFALQGAVTDTGAIHPDALTPEAQARMAEVLAMTAAYRGTSYEEEAARAAEKIRGLNPGETFPGVEKWLDAMQRGELVQLTPGEATGGSGLPVVDERPLAERMADPYGVGRGSIYYELAPEGTPGKDGAPGIMGGGALPWLALAGGLLFVTTRKTKRTRR